MTTETAKYTPGPWHMAGYGVLGPSAVLSDQICVTMTSRPTAERRANARLIAAATELLQVARFVIQDVDCYCPDLGDEDYRADFVCTHCLAKAAIAKAEKGA